MEKGLMEAFHKAKYEGKSGLAENIWHGIAARNKHIARIKLWAFSFTGIASLAGLIPAWKILSSDLAQSGLYEYFSLVFSSGGSVFSYWRELSLSIAESLPTMSIILSLSLVFVLFLSLKYASKQIIKGQLSLSF
jgi:hypothetical protein